MRRVRHREVKLAVALATVILTRPHFGGMVLAMRVPAPLRRTMALRAVHEVRARLYQKAELKRAEVTYEELASRLKEHGLTENAASIANKFCCRTLMAAMGAQTPDLEEI
jgi:hypothetical protein